MTPFQSPGGRTAFRRTLGEGPAAATLLTLPLLAGGASARSALPEIPALPGLIADAAIGSSEATGASGVGIGPASIGLTEVASPAMPAPDGTIRKDFGMYGDHEVRATCEVQACDDLLYSF